MAPGSVPLADGRIILVANNIQSGYAVDATKDYITGKVFVSASRKVVATITAISPTVVNYGYSATPVTITGTNFTAGSTAKIGSTFLTGLTITSTQITATLPVGVIMGVYDVTVTDISETSVSLINGFTVLMAFAWAVRNDLPNNTYWGPDNNALIFVDGVPTIFRSFVQMPPNKTLHIYQVASTGNGVAEVSIKEVPLSSYQGVTWNTQPVLGNTVATFSPTNSPGWYSFLTGTTGAICFKWTNEEPVVPYLSVSWKRATAYIT